MLSSDLISTRRRDRLHQTPIEAQPPQSGGAGLWARGTRNDFVPSYRPIQKSDSWVRRPRSVVCGLGGGAEQSFSILHDPDLKTERERVSNPKQWLPSPCHGSSVRSQAHGLPEQRSFSGSALMARVGRRAHPLSSFPYLDRAEQVERSRVRSPVLLSVRADPERSHCPSAARPTKRSRTAAARRAGCAAACSRRPGPAWPPGCSTLSPCRVSFPAGRSTSVPPRCRAGTERPLRRTPT